MLGALKFNSAKCETTCRLCLGRIKLLKNKRNMQMKQYRKDIADLLKAGKQDYARIRVEAVIREALTLTAYEILELYLELLAVRASLVATSKEIPRDMIEALSSVLYAASRVPDLPELTTLHKMFAQKYGKEYVTEACSDVSCNRWMVNERMRRCLTIEPPEPALKLETLSEIAQEYGVEWDMDRARRELLPDTDVLAPPHPTVAMPGVSSSNPLIYASSGQTPAQQQQHLQSHIQYNPCVPPPAAPTSAAAAPAAALPAAAAAPAAGVGGYTDAAAAAAAAVAAAQQARNAAEAAARLAAAGGQQRPGGGAGGGGGGAAVAAAAGGGGKAPPPQGWLAGLEAGIQQAPASPSAPKPSAAAPAAGNTVQMQPLPTAHNAGSTGSAAAADGGSGTGSGGGFRVPSAEEIQRAYDAALGPPAKPDSNTTAAAAAAAAAGPVLPPPAAPPVSDDGYVVHGVRPAAGAAAGADAADAGSSGNGDLGLPGVPHSGGSVASVASAPSSSAASEYDELQKRFEALKKS